MSSGKVESQYLVGAASPAGHSTTKPFDRMRRHELVVARRRPDPHGGKARRQGLVGALTPFHVVPGLGGQTHCKRLR